MAVVKLVVLTALTTVVLYMLMHVSLEKREHLSNFEESAATKVDSQIMLVYDEILMRQPSPVELSTQRTSISSNAKNIDGLRRELRDSEEYVRMLKTQSNALAPELPKLISDRDVFDLIAYMYKVERKKELKREMLLPLRDVYVYLSYNNARFRAFLRLSNYEDFEAAIRRDSTFDKSSLLAWIEKNVDQKELESLTRAVEAEIAEQNKAAAGRNSTASASAGCLTSGPACVTCPATVSGLDEQSAEFMAYMSSKCQGKDGNVVTCPAENKKLYIPPTHEGNMVLRPEFAWSVPQQRAPVCTRIGAATPVAPMMSTTMLIGTPLAESRDTAVGSIMPKFEFKPYIEVPQTMPSKEACSAISKK